MLTPLEVLQQIEILEDGNVMSRSSGKIYTKQDFVSQIKVKLKWTNKEANELESYLTTYVRAQSENSKYIQKIIEKYDFRFCDGVYFINNQLVTINDLYRFFWSNERLLPTETDKVIENVEKISELVPLQNEIFEKIKAKAIKGESKYVLSLQYLYPNIQWYSVLHNILCPNSKPLFHIFYDDGVGGTGKSTLLEVLTKIVGEDFVSNVLLDQFGNRFIFSNMLGKYLNIGDDNGRNDELQNVGTLKSIITGNRVTIDRKNISPIEVRIFAKQLFATNILPYIDFTDGGLMRRTNIVKMNEVIPKNMKLPVFDDKEIGAIIYNAINAPDLEKGENELAITSSPLYRFYHTSKNLSYDSYKDFCDNNGFRRMNIINFEVKSKFIKAYDQRKESKNIKMEKCDDDVF